MKEKESVVALQLPIGPLKTTLGLSQYQDVNPVPTSSLANDVATAPSKECRNY